MIRTKLYEHTFALLLDAQVFRLDIIPGDIKEIHKALTS